MHLTHPSCSVVHRLHCSMRVSMSSTCTVVRLLHTAGSNIEEWPVFDVCMLRDCGTHVQPCKDNSTQAVTVVTHADSQHTNATEAVHQASIPCMIHKLPLLLPVSLDLPPLLQSLCCMPLVLVLCHCCMSLWGCWCDQQQPHRVVGGLAGC